MYVALYTCCSTWSGMLYAFVNVVVVSCTLLVVSTSTSVSDVVVAACFNSSSECLLLIVVMWWCIPVTVTVTVVDHIAHIHEK